MEKSLLKLYAPQRLRAMADAFEAGRTLTDVAANFRVPATALQRVVGPKRKTVSSRLTPEVLEKAAARIRKGETFAKIAADLDIHMSVFTATMIKHGLTAKNLRPSPSPKIALAIAFYKQGRPISEVIRKSGYTATTLYSILRKHNIPLRVPKKRPRQS